MARTKQGLTRRNFIIFAAVTGGCLGFGLRLRSINSKDLRSINSKDEEIHHWIVISPDNTVTVRVAQMEMGQGAMTSTAQLLAEELELDWSNVTAEFILITRRLQRPDSPYGRTATSTSMGVKLSELLLRTAGAQIRTMFIRAASKRVGASESEFVAENSAITHISTGTKLTYGELVTEAAKVAIPDPASIKLKEPKDWTYIGKSLDRLDVPTKVDGTAVFGIDVQLPGMQYAAISISPVFGGKLLSCSPRAALSMPTVHRVIELKNVDGLDDAVAVVASDWWQAKKGLDALELKWDGGSSVTIDSATILKNLRTGLDGPPDKILRNNGDVESAFASAARVLEAEYFLPYLEAATMEPMNCSALVVDTGFEVWAPIQNPESGLRAAAKIAGMPIGKGKLHATQIGGGFGRRQETDFVKQAVYIAKTMKGVPLKLIWSREETMRHSFYRPANVSRVRAALDSNGKLIAWSHRIVAPSPNEVRNTKGSESLRYAIPNMRVDLAVRPSHVPEGQMRGVGLATHGFITQTFIDELARTVGEDVYKFQRALLDPDKSPAIGATGEPPTGKDKFGRGLGKPFTYSNRERTMRLRAVLDEAATKSDWGKPLGVSRGRGIAINEQIDSFFAVVVEVTLDGIGWLTIDRVVIAGDTGYLVNPACAEAQVEGSVAFALTSALYGEITIRQGRVVEANFNDYQILRIHEMPTIEVHWILNRQGCWGGVGEQVVAPVIPALVNAIYDAGGPRIRSLPLKNHKILKRDQEI